MGGDHGPRVIVPSAVNYLHRNPEINIILVGIPEAIKAQLSILNVKLSHRLRLYAATEVVDMNDQPSLALRSKKDSSMRVGVNLIKNGEAQACVSAGNTGAVICISGPRHH